MAVHLIIVMYNNSSFVIFILQTFFKFDVYCRFSIVFKFYTSFFVLHINRENSLFLFPGMLSRDYCDRKYQAVSDAQELFPQFLSESNDCSTDNEIILGENLYQCFSLVKQVMIS